MPPPSGTSVIAHRIEPPAGPRTPCVMHGDTELERERAQGEDETAGFLYLNRRAALSLLIPILVSFHVLLTALSTNYSKSDLPISTSALPFLSCQGRCTKNRFLLWSKQFIHAKTLLLLHISSQIRVIYPESSTRTLSFRSEKKYKVL